MESSLGDTAPSNQTAGWRLKKVLSLGPGEETETNKGVTIRIACANVYQDDYLEPELYVTSSALYCQLSHFLERTIGWWMFIEYQ